MPYQDDREAFLDQVCAQIRATPMHMDIREEIGGHFDELVEVKLAEGCSEEEASIWAKAQLGSPTELGRQLHSIHKPKLNWSILIAVFGLVTIGLVGLWFADQYYSTYENSNLKEVNFFGRQSIGLLIGVIAMVILYFVPYTWLRSYAWHIYVLISVVWILTRIEHLGVNGYPGFINLPFINFPIHIGSLSVYLYLKSISGMYSRFQMNRSNTVYFYLNMISVSVFPVLFLVNSLASLAIYLIAIICINYWYFRSKWIVILGSIMALGGSSLYMYMNERLANKFLAIFNVRKYAESEGYTVFRYQEALRSAGWWGQGNGTDLKYLPYIHSDSMFVYIVYYFGWIVGISVCLLVLFLATHFLFTYRQVRDQFGQSLVLIISLILIFRLVYSVLMALGLAPFIGMNFPFLNYGLSQLIIDFAGVGLMLGIYRRKDITSRLVVPM
ncbi:cell division protein FtsW (lipid II flippase) [Paenibacillus shirakamiensis]|uniref:Cell division protein FtsW (Lipid II flippase) n=1 Tax=Paenibacillus shirakamiensis TaxID=1265935 RepID=A0ABS4JHW5_9BACL|nr:FtsW/RodA/SpoVE family cell cycle protein [Paenibacillus shirakamiensis]MBP2001298.1 cell division protein FtsW (lipid II flippase) [Paenibacillus shirakamiensis]